MSSCCDDETRGDPAPRDSDDEPADGAGAGVGARQEEGGGGPTAQQPGTMPSIASVERTFLRSLYWSLINVNQTSLQCKCIARSGQHQTGLIFVVRVHNASVRISGLNDEHWVNPICAVG